MKTLLRNAALGLLGATALAVAGPANAAPFHHGNHFVFHHDFAHFTPREHAAWMHGHWWHGSHGGRFGWWWWTGGGWYFYDAPIYPYPTYYTDAYDYDDYDYGPGYDQRQDYGPGPGGGGYYWYHCSKPEGYYPYVKSCKSEWERVAPQPPGGPDDQDQGPDSRADHGPQQLHNGPPPGDNDDDNGPPPPPPR